MSVMNSLVMKLVEQIKGNSPSTSTPTNNDLNNSPRYIDINKPRTAQFSGADVNANTYGKSNEDIFKTLAAKEGGSILAKGNKLAKHKPTKLY